ncbi:MAG: butyrate kinase [Lachnospiraceae bacterium]|nr:butyrate kinase [Lachnospiraceae bacterium]
MSKDIMILVINLGSTSSKFAVYKNETELFRESIDHERELINSFPTRNDEIPFRIDIANEFLKRNGYHMGEFDAIAARAGNLANAEAGTYIIDEAICESLKTRPAVQHASNLCPIVAYELGEPYGIPAYMCDAPSVDQRWPVFKVTGIPEIEKYGGVHSENMFEVAEKTAEKLKKKYENCSFVIAHMGGGITYSLHYKGQVIDAYCDDAASFSPERAGILPSVELIELCFSGKYTEEELKRYMRGKGGLVAHLGTSDAREVEKMAAEGNEYAALIYDALIYNVAKSIASLAVDVGGDVDRIILTGGIAHSKQVVNKLTELLRFIAPLEIIPGEMEIKHIVGCTLKAFKNEIKVNRYKG